MPLFFWQTVTNTRGHLALNGYPMPNYHIHVEKARGGQLLLGSEKGGSHLQTKNTIRAVAYK